LLTLFLSASAPAAINGCLVADLNGDGTVDELDAEEVEADLGLASPRKDLDGSGLVDDADVALAWSYRKACPLHCLADVDGDGEVGEVDRLWVEAFAGFDCRGDLNRDGQICPRDAGVMNAYLGSPTPLSPSAARADLNEDGVVDQQDVEILRALYETDCSTDLNRDNKVDADDLAWVLAAWGPCPPALRTKGDPKNTCIEEDP
jgi:hypothetical protein